MSRPLRPTLRCLKEDLGADWDDVEQHRAIMQGRRPGVPLHELAHPLVKATADRFASPASPEAAAARENISGTREPTWWKAKSGRWRGAIYLDPQTDQAWLCAAGLRYEGEVTKDFYKVFTANVAVQGGAQAYLPTQADEDELALEQSRSQIAEWEVAAAEAIMQAVGAHTGEGTRVAKLPDLGSFRAPHVEIELYQFDESEWDQEPPESVPAEVSLRLVITDWSNRLLLRRVQIVACATIAPNPEAWDSVPGSDETCTILATIDESRLKQIRAAVRLETSVGDTPAPSGLVVLPSSSAHWTHKNLLARATVEGSAVPALCGTWFVPTQDPLKLPVCDECAEHFESVFAS